MKNKAFISLVVYLHNDTDSIEEFIRTISPVINDNFELNEFIFIDDGSTDDTYTKITGLIEKMKINAFVFSLAYRHNKESALLAGVDKSVGDFVYQFESSIIDYPTDFIIDMFDEIKSGGYDIISLRPIGQYLKYQTIYNYLFNMLSFRSMNVAEERITLSTRKALNSLSSINERLRYNKALVNLLGLYVRNMSYRPINDKYSDNRSNAHLLKIFFINVISYTNIGTKLSFYISFIFILCSIYFGIQILYLFFINNEVVSDLNSLMLFLSMSFSAMFLVFGVLNSNITKTLKEIVNYPSYNIKKSYKHFS